MNWDWLGVSVVVAGMTIALNPGGGANLATPAAQANPANSGNAAASGDWEKAIKFVQKWEGDGAASSVDLGGPTRFGVTQSLWTGLGVPEPQTKEAAAAIFKRIYWDGGPRCAQYKAPLNAVCFDTAVNFGPGGNGTTNQGWRSLSAGVDLTDPIAASKAIIQRRLAWRDTMVARRPEQVIHRKGWQARDLELLKRMVGG